MEPKAAYFRKTEEEFRPDPSLKAIHYLDLLLFVLIGIMSWFFPLMVYGPPEVVLLMAVILIPVLAMSVIYIPIAYRHTAYRLTESEITWKRGVFFKRASIVPYSKVTNVDISQGPLSRYFGIANLNIQTAGYNASSGGQPELRISGIKDHEKVRDMIMSRVRSNRPPATQTGSRPDLNELILAELTKIRELLERRSGP